MAVFSPTPMMITPSTRWLRNRLTMSRSRSGSFSVVATSASKPAACPCAWIVVAIVWIDELTRLVKTTPISPELPARSARATAST